MTPFLGLASQFWVDRRGVAATEMALIAPTLMAMLLGMSEVARKLHAQHNAAQAATTVGDMISRYQTLTAADITGVLDASTKIVGSSDFADNGFIILSSATRAAKAKGATVSWQCSGGGTAKTTSKIGKPGDAATLPGTLSLDDDDYVIIAEVFYNYKPVIQLFDRNETPLYNVSTFRPRLGALTSAPGCK